MKKHHQSMELQRQGESSSSSNNEVAEPSNPTSVTVHDEIILSILERLLKLPAKSLLQFKAVCKQWLCLIESPYFINCHLKYSLEHLSDRISLFISAKSSVTHGYFCVSLSGGQTTRFSLPNFPYQSQVEHLNGLSIFHSRCNFAYIINPTTHQVLKLPQAAYFSKFSADRICYFLGFHPVCNDFKVLNTRIIAESKLDKRRIECWIFSLRNHSWKKIEPFFPFDMLRLDLHKEGVCINGVIYILLDHNSEIAAFDLMEEKFSIIPLPVAAVPSGNETHYRYGGLRHDRRKFNCPYLLNYNGLLVVVSDQHVLTQSVLELWILQDFQNQVWVMETITLPRIWWIDFGASLPVDVIATGEIMFEHRKLSDQREQITFYDMKTRSFRAVEIILPRGFSALSCKGYVESIWPLRSNC